MTSPPTTARRIRLSAGFTLIELLIAMVVSSIVVMGVFAFSTIQKSTAGMHQRNVRIQQALEGAMWSVGRDVRSAGLGFTRLCTELRVWDQGQGLLINPGGATSAAAAYRDEVTDQAYWALRDGIQVYWDSAPANIWEGATNRSSDPLSAADAFDVILGEGNYVQSYGVFTLPDSIDTAGAVVVVETSSALNNTDAQDLLAVQQMFPPGSFFILAAPARAVGGASLAFEPLAQSQCPLLQVTDDVQADAGNANQWVIPVGPVSGFNGNLSQLLTVDNTGSAGVPNGNFEGDQVVDDWDPTRVNAAGSSVVPLGRLRWSRYEIDYTIARLPYLVRYDLIGYQAGVDPGNLGSAVEYPYCAAGACTAAQLHLPGTNPEPAAVAIGPMIEDMQVAVGCDGYSAGGLPTGMPVPDLAPQSFAEVGPSTGALAGLPNAVVDENPVGENRDRDEWLGNAVDEFWAPDCVWYGAGQYYASGWGGVESDVSPPGNFRMSPQSLRVTLTATAEGEAEFGGIAGDTVQAIEDRPAMTSVIPGRHERITLTERFTPANLRWRDPSMQ